MSESQAMQSPGASDGQAGAKRARGRPRKNPQRPEGPEPSQDDSSPHTVTGIPVEHNWHPHTQQHDPSQLHQQLSHHASMDLMAGLSPLGPGQSHPSSALDGQLQHHDTHTI